MAALSTAIATYHITKTLTKKQEQDRVLKQANEMSLVKANKTKSQIDKGLPAGTLTDAMNIDQVYLWELEDLKTRFPSSGDGIENVMQVHLPSTQAARRATLKASTASRQFISSKSGTPYNKVIGEKDAIIADPVRKPNGTTISRAYIRAGPREKLHFNPREVKAAIVTCGGLCPGLNNVVRGLTNALYHLYGAKKVTGITGGYKGFYDPEYPPIDLTPEVVEFVHHQGGTFLASSRGGFDLDKIIAFLKKHDICQLYVIGGDGTHRGAFRIHEGCMERGLNVAVAGIPKTIDNDIDHVDRTFGFETAVEHSQQAIRCAKVEAKCNKPNGIGIVKLMGRSAGFIAAHATMCSGDVDLCLVPEVPIVLEGKNGCLPHIRERVKQQGFAVIVVAEGAGEELLGESAETDASGNKKLPAIGEFLKAAVVDYFKERGDEATVKYIDPSYMIRSVPANASDSIYCMQLAQNAVHGAMAGYTGFSVGLCNNKTVLLPIPELVATSPKHMDPKGRTWERVLALTRQPNTV